MSLVMPAMGYNGKHNLNERFAIRPEVCVFYSNSFNGSSQRQRGHDAD
jgi:hypothetical protein